MSEPVYRKANSGDVQEIAELSFSVISNDIETQVPFPCEFSKQKNHTFIDLQVWDNNQQALKLYEKTGFKTVEKRMVKKL